MSFQWHADLGVNSIVQIVHCYHITNGTDMYIFLTFYEKRHEVSMYFFNTLLTKRYNTTTRLNNNYNLSFLLCIFPWLFTCVGLYCPGPIKRDTSFHATNQCVLYNRQQFGPMKTKSSGTNACPIIYGEPAYQHWLKDTEDNGAGVEIFFCIKKQKTTLFSDCNFVSFYFWRRWCLTRWRCQWSFSPLCGGWLALLLPGSCRRVPIEGK